MYHRDEGTRDYPYDDETSQPVRCVGNCTIGVGHNLKARPLKPRFIELLLEDDIQDTWDECIRLFTSGLFSSLSTHRQLGLHNFVYTLGEDKIRTKFPETYPALCAEQWPQAALLIRRTKWMVDVKPGRAERVLAMIEREEFPYE